MADYLTNFENLCSKVGDDEALRLWPKWYGSTVVTKAGGITKVLGDPKPTEKPAKNAGIVKEWAPTVILAPEPLADIPRVVRARKIIRDGIIATESPTKRGYYKNFECMYHGSSNLRQRYTPNLAYVDIDCGHAVFPLCGKCSSAATFKIDT